MNPIEKLTAAFERFPGIGPRQARRFVQHLLSGPESARRELSQAIAKLGSETRVCGRCYRWFVKSGGSEKLCAICTSPRRDATALFVVEKDADLDNVEKSGFKGLYFVLGGTIPLASEEPGKHIRLQELLVRLQNPEEKLAEVILGLSATTEGEHTRQILQEKIEPLALTASFKLTSLGRGLSTGSELEYADPDTIAQALGNRH